MAKKKKKKLKPVSIAGIEFDALLEQQKTLSATIPVYPVEKGFPVSDTIVIDPLTLSMTLFVTNTPVTWMKRHNEKNRVKKICNRLEDLWQDRKLVKIVTPDAIYKNMGITSITIKKSAELGYAREISITAQKVRKTKKKTVKVPKYKLKSGETKEESGKAQTSETSSAETSVSDASDSSSGSSGKSSASSSSKSSGSSSSKSSGKNSNAKKGQSILYGVAKGLKFI